jgi:hypothetical protein
MLRGGIAAGAWLMIVASCGGTPAATSSGTPATALTSSTTTTTTAPVSSATTAATTTTAAAVTTTAAPPATTTTEATPLEATGVVIAVDGNLTGVASFTIRLEDGSDLHLAPVDGLLFDGTSPISHVRDHLVSGAPVSVTYLPTGGPLFPCTAIGDAGGEGTSHDA